MASRNKPFDYVSVTATSTDGMNNGDRVRFHYMNPRGLHNEQRLIDAAVRALVDAGKVRSGALIAYGSLDDFYSRWISAMLDQKPSTSQVGVMIDMYGRRNAAARAFVVENGGFVALPVTETVEQARARREMFMHSLVSGDEGQAA